MTNTTQTTVKPQESYGGLKSRQEREFSAFEGVFFAFNKEQLAEGLIKVNAKDTSEIYSIGSGGFIRKDASKAFNQLMTRHEYELKALKRDEATLLKALVYELQNHEYCV